MSSYAVDDWVTYDGNWGQVTKVIARSTHTAAVCVVEWENGNVTTVWQSDLQKEKGPRGS